MKVLHIGKFYSPVPGGIESVNKFIIDVLKDSSQRIICFNTKRKTEKDIVKGVPVLRVGSMGCVASQPISWKYFFLLRKEIAEFTPDIIHYHYPNPLIGFYLCLLIPPKTKLIVHWHSDVVEQKTLRYFISEVEQKLLRRSNVIITTSPNYAKASCSLKPFRDKIKIIPCAIDENLFNLQMEDEKKILDIKHKYNRPIVFFVGRHVKYKGLKYLLEAEKFIKNDCVFLIAGNGPLTKELKGQYLSDRIRWLGRLSDEEMKLYYHAAFIFAFPSITRNEAFGVVLAESMYCGCPSVTFTIAGSGVNWVSLNNTTCIEVENGNCKAYAKAIDYLLSDDVQRERMGHNAKERVLNFFTKEKVAYLYKDLYTELYSLDIY